MMVGEQLGSRWMDRRDFGFGSTQTVNWGLCAIAATGINEAYSIRAAFRAVGDQSTARL